MDNMLQYTANVNGADINRKVNEKASIRNVVAFSILSKNNPTNNK